MDASCMSVDDQLNWGFNIIEFNSAPSFTTKNMDCEDLAIEI